MADFALSTQKSFPKCLGVWNCPIFDHTPWTNLLVVQRARMTCMIDIFHWWAKVSAGNPTNFWPCVAFSPEVPPVPTDHLQHFPSFTYMAGAAHLGVLSPLLQVNEILDGNGNITDISLPSVLGSTDLVESCCRCWQDFLGILWATSFAGELSHLSIRCGLCFTPQSKCNPKMSCLQYIDTSY